MLSSADSDLDNRARQLLQRLADAYDPVYGLGCFSCAVYDTAWVAMVSKVVDGQMQWLFPSSFRLLLDTQLPDGGWGSDSEFDGILNTMAATLALRKVAATPYQLNELLPSDLDTRIFKAISYLRSRLAIWDIQATLHVGYEILVPALLDMLAQDGVGFQFDGKQLLMVGRDKRMSKLDPTQFYGSCPTTALHSLEAFIGRIDFDRLTHHETFGSMMASPYSTAVYLMHCSTWRNESEAYLHRVISAGEGKGNGGVPSAFPSTLFETTWVISTLLPGGFTPDALDWVQLSVFTHIFEHSLSSGDGVVGFAPLIGPDADDTAKIITTLSLLGRTANPSRMIAEYETQDHFKTYSTERDPSFSTNCNVLYALLNVPAGSIEYGAQIEKATRYLCDRWWRADDNIVDKWNLSPFYSSMLMSQALMQVLVFWDRGLLPSFPDQLLNQKVPIVLFQALTRTLQSQNSDGSWGNGHYCEETSYAILTLVSLTTLPLFHSLLSSIRSAIQKGRLFIHKAGGKPSKPERLWIEKVTYGSAALSESYILASLKIAPSTTHKFGANIQSLFHILEKNVIKFTKLYKQLPLFATTPERWIEAAVIEGYQFLPQLKQLRLDIFARKDMEEDKYFEYIPSTWTVSNVLDSARFGAKFLFDMMVISLLNYQADEYMEAVVGAHYSDRLDEIRRIIDIIFSDNESATANSCIPERSAYNLHNNCDTANGSSASLSTRSDGQAPSLAEVHQTLTRFTDHILYHPHIQCASSHDRAHLAYELRTFLLAHVTQIQDSARFFPQPTPKSPNVTPPLPSFFSWVRATSADHTSCPYSFAFATCLMATNRHDLFATPEAKYVAQAVCRHLATLCRMYNDYGSLARDHAEQNLNSVHFEEFGFAERDEEKRAALWRIAAFERRCLDLALEELGTVAGLRAVRFVRLFCRVTDMYGQIYVVKDIASRMKG